MAAGAGEKSEPVSPDYIEPTGYIWQFKQLEFKFSGSPTKLGTVDALNNITWSGNLDVQITGPWRLWQSGRWGAWASPPWRNPGFSHSIPIYKKDGTWLINGLPLEKVMFGAKPSCDVVK